MRREGQPCYVGLLKAAELHGATHQAVMEFQVVSNKRLPKIHAGRNLIVFHFRKEMEAVTAGIEDRKTDTGTMKISSAALTVLDLLRYPRASGGIDHVATVLSDLGGKLILVDSERRRHRATDWGRPKLDSVSSHGEQEIGPGDFPSSWLRSSRTRRTCMQFLATH